MTKSRNAEALHEPTPTRCTSAAARSSVEATAARADPQKVERLREALPELYSLEEVAAVLKLTTRAVSGLIKKGELKGRKIGVRWVVTGDAVRAFVNGEQL
jgi:hypothetical protein